MDMLTDNEKALRALRQAGKDGIHSFALNKIIGTTRAAARINDLKKRGHTIASQPELLGHARGARYFLVSSPMEKQKPQYAFDASRQVFVQL